MMIRPLNRHEARQVDRIAIDQYGISGLVLMENAGRDSARWILSHFPPGNVCILCGKGNNGGDGYVIARHIDAAKIDTDRSKATEPAAASNWNVRIVSVVDPAELVGDAAVNQNIAERSGIDITVAQTGQSLSDAMSHADIIVDCLLGTGASGDPRGPMADAIRIANASTAKRVAIDLPSGLDCDTGVTGDPTFQADATLTFVAPKIGFDTPAARQVIGRMVTIAIGVPSRLLERYRA
jgi:NAD(P)H-hydrate epimerase